MKRLLIVIVALIVIGLVAVFLLDRPDTAAGVSPALAGAPASAALVARGEYLTKAADCVACHTVQNSGKAFAGGVAFKLPVGTIYSTNITPDPTHGIGAYSDDEFVSAVREGVRRDGQHLYPAFPYTSYTELSRDDVLAIKAYLMSLPAIAEPNRPNDLGFPFDQRWAMSFWNAAFFKDRRFVPDASKPEQWNSGAYLATALGHCAECHTPRNVGFGLEHGHELAGEELQGWRAYNITSDPKYGIGGWSDADIAAYLTTGHAAGHASASGPMGEAVSHSLQFLNPQDAAALVAYLRTRVNIRWTSMPNRRRSRVPRRCCRARTSSRRRPRAFSCSKALARVVINGTARDGRPPTPRSAGPAESTMRRLSTSPRSFSRAANTGWATPRCSCRRSATRTPMRRSPHSPITWCRISAVNRAA
jgi:mono/diheme cytochrome c family protein